MRAVTFPLGLVISLVLASCDSDKPEQASPADATNQADTDTSLAEDLASDPGSNDATSETTEEVAPSPCEGVVCDDPPEPSCNVDRTALVTSALIGTCEDGEGEASCTYPEQVTDCAAERSFCFDRRCMTEQVFKCEVPAEVRRWSRVTTFAAGNQSDPDPTTGEIPDACCFDFDGDGQVDNRLGEIFWQNRALLGDLNSLWQQQIDRGTTRQVFEVRGLDDTTEPLSAPSVDVFGSTAIESMAGELGFEHHDELTYAFLPGTKIPRWVFAGSITDGRLVGTGRAVIRTGADGLGGHIEFTLEDYRFDGRVALGPNEVGLEVFGDTAHGARFGGLVPVRDLYELINKTVKHLCQCAVFEDGVEPVDLETGICATPISNTCGSSETFCLALTEPFCTNLLGTLFVPDIDRDGDGAKESLSAGLWMKATSAYVDLCAD